MEFQEIVGFFPLVLFHSSESFSSSIFHTQFLSWVNVYSDVIFNWDATLTVIHLRLNTSMVTGSVLCILKWNRMLCASLKMQLSLSEALSFPKSCFSPSCFTKEDHCSYGEQTCISIDPAGLHKKPKLPHNQLMTLVPFNYVGFPVAFSERRHVGQERGSLHPTQKKYRLCIQTYRACVLLQRCVPYINSTVLIFKLQCSGCGPRAA